MKSGFFSDKLLNFIRPLKSLPRLINIYQSLFVLQLLKERLEGFDAFMLAILCEHH